MLPDVGSGSGHSQSNGPVGSLSPKSSHNEVKKDEWQPLLKNGGMFGTAAVPPWAMTLTVIICWYASNTGLLILNKWLLGSYGFKRPVFLTLCHMVACSAMGSLSTAVGLVAPQPMRSIEQFRKIAALATVFCLSVVLGNVGLRFIPLSFSQAIGATTPVFTAVLAVVMMRKYEAPIVYFALLPVVVGIVIATGAEPSFNMVGFTAVIIATAMRALKSVLQGILLSDASEKMDSMNLLRCMAPIACLCLLPAVAILEPTVIREAIDKAATTPNFVALLLFNSFLAYFTNLTNFLVTRYTSALTLQVLGNAKGVFTTVLSIAIFQNPYTAASATGYLITVAGVGCYAAAKRHHIKVTQQKETSQI